MSQLKISAKMLDTLKQLQSTSSGQTTSFGHVPGQAPSGKTPYNPVHLNASTVKALVARGLLEEHGTMPCGVVIDGVVVGNIYPLYRISAKGEQVLQPKTYTNWEEAQAAMDRGETVRVEQEPFTIDPRLVQLAQDLQDKQRLEEWRLSTVDKNVF